MSRFQRWSPDTCECQNLYQVIEDDGTWRMASVLEVRDMHMAEYLDWQQKLSVLGLTPGDVQSRTTRWKLALQEAERAQRLHGIPQPPELTNGVLDPVVYDQVPHKICRVHYEMGHPEEDDDSDEAQVKRGAILAENLTKNEAIKAVIDALGTPDEEHGAVVESLRWSFAPPTNGERAVRLELPTHLKEVKAAIEAKISQRVGGAVAIVDSVDAERANDIALGVSDAFTMTP